MPQRVLGRYLGQAEDYPGASHFSPGPEPVSRLVQQVKVLLRHAHIDLDGSLLSGLFHADYSARRRLTRE